MVLKRPHFSGWHWGYSAPDSGAITCTVSKGELGQLINAPFAYPELTVQQNLHMLSQLYSMNPTCITNSLEQWKLEHYCNDQFRHLSLGNKQRVGLAGALQHQPRLILLDEPTNALDPLGIMILRETLMQRARMGCGVVVSSHHLDEVSAIADRIVVLHAGRIIAELPAHTPNLEQQFFQLILTEDQTHERGK